jgi:ATP-dependent exoDNAse (exonuclease V) beta subunit
LPARKIVFGIEGLVCVATTADDRAAAREENELRLGSDDDAVRIVTIHKSKGLEYGITFYPHAKREPWQ